MNNNPPANPSSLLRFSTAGSVDDGKSTLIGRLLLDSKAIFRDQLEAVAESSRNSGEEEINLALLLDGLKAEREQKITIDVAYRYFATPRRKFIIADTPGHIQYTRNMVTGASTADLAIVLVDARKGILTQSKRHAFIASLLQIPHMVVAINKMDLIGYDEKVFQEIVKEFTDFSQKLNIDDISFIPISALLGDNIVHKSEHMDWYNGATLMYKLENVQVGSRRNRIDFRMPVQYVIRPNQDFRGFAGTVASGSVRMGDDIMVLPSRLKSKVTGIHQYTSQLEEANGGEAVTLTIADDLDISRGDMIVRTRNVPETSREFEAIICWMGEDKLDLQKQYLLMHTTQTIQAVPLKLHYKINVDTLHRENADTLQLNEIGRIRLATAKPLFFDPYTINNETGSFIIIDPTSHVTVGAGMIRGILSEENGGTQLLKEEKSPNVVWEPWNISREERQKRHGHPPLVIWFTGVSGAGKSSIARALEIRLWSQGRQTMLLDGDQIRHGLSADLGFNDRDRTENIRRVGELAKLFYEHGNIVLCSFVSPFKSDRERVRKLFPTSGFIEVQVTCERDTAIQRDPKGLYAKAKKGEITGLTGFDGVYELNENAEITLQTDFRPIEDCVHEVLEYIHRSQFES